MHIFFLQIKDSMVHNFTTRSYNWLISYGPKIIIAIAVFFVGQLIIRLLNRWIKKILSVKRFNATIRPFIQNLLQILLQAGLILLIMQLLGIQMTLFAAVLGALGVAVGLALSGTLQNFAGGFLIIILKPFSVGENIMTQGEAGTVTAIRLFYTVIRTFTNTTLIVPNSKLSNEVIFNLTREKKRRMDVLVKFPHGITFGAVKEAADKVIASFADNMKEETSRIGVNKIEDDGFTVTINIWTASHGFHDTLLKFNEELLIAFEPLYTVKK